MGTLKVDNIESRTGSAFTIGASGDTITIQSGATLETPGLTLSDNILFDTASKGIYLGVTSATASNLLDDYEEGTWTPVFLGGGTNPTLTYSVQDGSYRKIGNFVYFDGKIQADTVSNVGSGNLRVGGLPFTPASGNERGFAVHTVQTVDTNMGYVQIIEATQTYWICRTNTNGVSQSEIQTSTLANSEQIHFSGAYKTS